MERAFKVRIYPNENQIQLLNQTFGCVRYIYNYFLNRKINFYEENNEGLTLNACSKELTQLKKENEWLQSPDKCALQNTLKNLDTAYQNFFNKRANFPKFKSRKSYKDSYKTNCNLKFENNKIRIPKIGWIKIKGYREISGRILSITISKNKSNQFFASICVTEFEPEQFEKTNQNVGIDLGLKEFAIFNTGEKINNPRFFVESQKKLAKMQRKLSKKVFESNNYFKYKIKVARFQEKIKNQRLDFLHKLSIRLVKEYDIICVETLRVKNMMKNHKLAKSIQDVSLSEFVRQLEYKARWYRKVISKINTFYPSSQLCSNCGYKNPDIKNLEIREYNCPVCDAHHDRDINAAINILNEGLRILNSI